MCNPAFLLFPDRLDPPRRQVRPLHALGRRSGPRHHGRARQGARHRLLHPQGQGRVRAEPQDGVLKGGRAGGGRRAGRRRGRGDNGADAKEQLGEDWFNFWRSFTA